MKAFALAALALTVAGSASAQSGSYPDPALRYSSDGRYGYDVNPQADRPGDYRCDAYWDRGRDDCGASWRDQRRYSSQAHGPEYGHRRYSSYGHGQGGGYVYQPYSQGTRYYGAYGRPDQVYPGGGYGGQVGGYGQYAGHGDRGRSSWCAARYRSYDPGTGYYRAYSGRLVFCG